ncbi:MAG: type II toxin-antitoxin system VapC family toxin [Beijerinckiaceae bacterium]
MSGALRLPVTEPIVLDSSAILALLNDEPGAERVEAILDRAVVGVANLAEVAAKLSEKGLSRAEVEEALAILHDVRPMSREHAIVAGMLRLPTRSLGLSLGDRACLALAMELKACAMTCDGAWANLDPSAIGQASVEMLR